MHRLGNEIKIEEREERGQGLGGWEGAEGQDEVKIEFDPAMFPPVVWQPLRTTPPQPAAFIPKESKDPSRATQLKSIRKAFLQALLTCTSPAEYSDFMHKFRRYRRSTAIIFSILMHLLTHSQPSVKPFAQLMQQKVEDFAKDSTLDQPEAHCLTRFLNQFLFGEPAQAVDIFFEKFETISYNAAKAAKMVKVLERSPLEEVESLDLELQSSASFQSESFSKVRMAREQNNMVAQSQERQEVEIEESAPKAKATTTDPFLIYKSSDDSRCQLYPSDTQLALTHWPTDLLPP